MSNRQDNKQESLNAAYKEKCNLLIYW